MRNKFRFKFYLNSNHAVLFNKTNISSIHNHSWELSIYLIEEKIELNQFSEIEKTIKDYLEKYNQETINEIYPFTRINPTMENLGFVFFKDVEKLLIDSIYTLEKIEVSENPTRTYIVNSARNYKEMENDKFEEIMRLGLKRAKGKLTKEEEYQLYALTQNNKYYDKTKIDGLRKNFDRLKRGILEEEISKTKKSMHEKRKTLELLKTKEKKENTKKKSYEDFKKEKKEKEKKLKVKKVKKSIAKNFFLGLIIVPTVIGVIYSIKDLI